MQDRRGNICQKNPAMMELRNCSMKHYIQTIRGGLVIKKFNVNSNGRPVSRTKTLKDIYDSEDAKRPQKSSSDSVFDEKQVKEGIRILVPARILREVKHEPDDSNPSVNGDSDSDLDDATTLSQLKNRLFTKKRKYASPNSKAVEDESDLNEPLISLKREHSKTTREKRRCLNPSVISSATSKAAIKFEENLVSESSQQACLELAPLVRVKAEVQDAEQFGSQNEMPTTSSAGHNELPNSGEKTVLPEYILEPLSHVNRYEECLTNEISYDHLESDCEDSLGSALDGITKLKEIPNSGSSVTSCSDDPNADVSCHSSSSSLVKDIPEECNSGCQVPDVAIDSGSSVTTCSDDPSANVSCHSSSSLLVEDIPEECSHGCQFPDVAVNDCIKLPQGSNCVLFEDNVEADLPSDKNCLSDQGSITTPSSKENPTSMKENIADKEELLTSSFGTIMTNNVNSEGQTEDEVLKALDKQSPECTENEYSMDASTCDNADTSSIQEQQQLPERLFSTRKAFSPSSEEQLCLAMNSVEIWDESNKNIDSASKRKLFENKIREKPSSLRSEIQNDKKLVNCRLPGQVNQRKVVIIPRRMSKKSQIAKGNLEGPRFSRTLPNLSTGCTSVEDCSESAVAFSQRQMHDMESIAVKLMNELNSMKDIVEQKLLFEAYRNTSLKNDADEVKSAITNAIRAEEMAKKWMSMMARDCNRFCKIMKMTPDSTSPKDTPPKGERKIMFADEAGRKLCQMFFYDNTALPASDAVDQ